MSDELMIVSNSEIQCYKRCKRKWWLSYYRKLVPIREEVVGVRSVGTRVHACVALYYEMQARGEEASLDVVMDLHDELVEADVIAVPEQEGDIRKDADLSRAMVEGYIEWLEESGADEGITPIAIEEEVAQVIETPVTHTPVEIRAKLDLRVKYEGPNEVEDMFMDHKSVAEFTTPTRVLHLDEQMLLYTWLLQWKLGENDEETYDSCEYTRQNDLSSEQSTDAVDVCLLQGTDNSALGGRGSTTSKDVMRTSRRSRRNERLSGESSSDASRLSLQTSQQGKDEAADNGGTSSKLGEGSTKSSTRSLQKSYRGTERKQSESSKLVVSGAIYNMIRRVKRTRAAKPPFFDRMTIHHSPQQLRSFHNRLMGELEEIIRIRSLLETCEVTGDDPGFYVFPTPTRNCHWDCPYFDVCGLIDRPDDNPDHYLSMIFEEGDPYARYVSDGATLE